MSTTFFASKQLREENYGGNEQLLAKMSQKVG